MSEIVKVTFDDGSVADVAYITGEELDEAWLKAKAVLDNIGLPFECPPYNPEER